MAKCELDRFPVYFFWVGFRAVSGFSSALLIVAILGMLIRKLTWLPDVNLSHVHRISLVNYLIMASPPHFVF